jgi:protoheme IX farnesyltransferase
VEEYRAANFPLLPVVKGIPITKVQMVIYIVLMVPTLLMLYWSAETDVVFLVGSLLLTFVWLLFAIAGFKTKNVSNWSRNIFLYSILYLILIVLLVMVDVLLMEVRG